MRQLSEKEIARNKKNRGTIGHGQPIHHTTDPKLHLERAHKAIREYMRALRKRNKR